MAACICRRRSAACSTIAQTFVRFFDNHGLLTVGPHCTGAGERRSRSYVERIVAPLPGARGSARRRAVCRSLKALRCATRRATGTASTRWCACSATGAELLSDADAPSAICSAASLLVERGLAACILVDAAAPFGMVELELRLDRSAILGSRQPGSVTYWMNRCKLPENTRFSSRSIRRAPLTCDGACALQFDTRCRRSGDPRQRDCIESRVYATPISAAAIAVTASTRTRWRRLDVANNWRAPSVGQAGEHRRSATATGRGRPRLADPFRCRPPRGSRRKCMSAAPHVIDASIVHRGSAAQQCVPLSRRLSLPWPGNAGQRRRPWLKLTGAWSLRRAITGG